MNFTKSFISILLVLLLTALVFGQGYENFAVKFGTIYTDTLVAADVDTSVAFYLPINYKTTRGTAADYQSPPSLVSACTGVNYGWRGHNLAGIPYPHPGNRALCRVSGYFNLGNRLYLGMVYTTPA